MLNLRFLNRVGFFFENRSDTFGSVLIYGKEQESPPKCHNCAKYLYSCESLAAETRFFSDTEKSNSKRLFSDDPKCTTVTRE